MSGRYERVSSVEVSSSLLLGLLADTFALRLTQLNAHDQDDDDHIASPTDHRSRTRLSSQPAPSSPPPSFHSRASSTAPRNRRVDDPALADAFDADESDSDDEPDDRQRLVRQNSDIASQSNSGSSTRQPTPLTGSSGASTPATRPPPAPSARPIALATTSSNRIFGSGIQNDGIFSNLTAKPERAGTEKEEQPPVRRFPIFPFFRVIVPSPLNLARQQFANTVFFSLRLIDLRASRRGCRTTLLGNDHSCARTRWAR